MSVLRLLLVVAVLGLCVHWWTGRREEKALQAVMSPNGFLPVPMPDGAVRNTVLIFAPLNCPREGAQRADGLSQKLTRLGIPNVRTSHYSLGSYEQNEEQIAIHKRLDVVMTGELPVVLINSMGKANPTVDELVLEYNRTQ
jgi:hypothetical protein